MPLRIRAVRDGLSLVGAGVLILVILPAPGVDIHAYWALDTAAPYSHGSVGTIGAFLYTPVAALAVFPLHLLPFALVRALWLVAELACLCALAGRWTLAWIAFAPIAQDLSAGNVGVFLAAAIVLGFRYPAAWSFLLLTKVTPGIGILWFAVRREWAPLTRAVIVTVVLAGATYAVAPGWWVEWLAVMRASQSVPVQPWGTLWLRLPLAAALIVWGASTDRRWVVPVASALAVPIFWTTAFAILVGAASLHREGRRCRITAGGPGKRAEAEVRSPFSNPKSTDAVRALARQFKRRDVG